MTIDDILYTLLGVAASAAVITPCAICWYLEAKKGYKVFGRVAYWTFISALGLFCSRYIGMIVYEKVVG